MVKKHHFLVIFKIFHRLQFLFDLHVYQSQKLPLCSEISNLKKKKITKFAITGCTKNYVKYTKWPFPKIPLFFFPIFFFQKFQNLRTIALIQMDSLVNNFLGLIYQFEIPKFSKKSYFPFNCKKKQSERHNVNNKKMQNEILNKSLLM